MTAVAGGEEFNVVGSVMGSEHEPRLVRALGYEIEIALEPLMLFVVNDDRPGRIGRIGTLLGEARHQHRQHGRLAQPAERRARSWCSRSTARSRRTCSSAIRAEPGLLDPRAIVLERTME